MITIIIIIPSLRSGIFPRPYYPPRPSETGLESLAGIWTAKVSSGLSEGLEVPFHAPGKVSAYMLACAADMRIRAGQIKKVGTLIPTLH